MTNYQVTANPNATNSELDAKQIVSTTIPDCDLPVTLTEDQISTILYVLEGYVQGNDDEELVEKLEDICYRIDKKLEATKCN